MQGAQRSQRLWLQLQAKEPDGMNWPGRSWAQHPRVFLFLLFLPSTCFQLFPTSKGLKDCDLLQEWKGRRVFMTDPKAQEPEKEGNLDPKKQVGTVEIKVMGQTQEFLGEKELIDLRQRSNPGWQGGHVEAQPLQQPCPRLQSFTRDLLGVRGPYFHCPRSVGSPMSPESLCLSAVNLESHA